MSDIYYNITIDYMDEDGDECQWDYDLSEDSLGENTIWERVVIERNKLIKDGCKVYSYGWKRISSDDYRFWRGIS